MPVSEERRRDVASQSTALVAVERRAPRPRGRARRQASLGTVGVFVAAAIGVISFYHPDRPLLRRPFVSIAEAAAPAASPSANAFGKSGEVRVRFSLPDQAVEYPIDVQGDPRSLSYQWVRVGDTAATATLRPLAGNVVAPSAPGFYRLALTRRGVDAATGQTLITERRVVDGMTLAVLVPFSQKAGSMLNGYRIGTYLAERLKGGSHDHPEGFVQVGAEDVNLELSKHLRLGDFVKQVAQDTRPLYAELNPQLVD
jgi:hypothetical protein